MHRAREGRGVVVALSRPQDLRPRRSASSDIGHRLRNSAASRVACPPVRPHGRQRHWWAEPPVAPGPQQSSPAPGPILPAPRDTTRSSAPSPSARPERGDQSSTRRALARGEVLVADLVGRLVPDLRVQVDPHQAEDHGGPGRGRSPDALVGEVITPPRRVGGSPAIALRERHVGGRAVLDVEVIANQCPVGPDDRALPPQGRADRSRDDPVPVQVAAAVEVPAAGDRDGDGRRSRRTEVHDQVASTTC